MPEPRDLRDLVGDDLDAGELERLRRVHDLLLSAGPPPELSPALQSAPDPTPRRLTGRGFSWFGRPRLAAAIAFAAGIAAMGFGVGFLAGHTSSGGFKTRKTVAMHGTAATPNARASIEIGKTDSSGNTPMIVHVTGLAKSSKRVYYELYVTSKRRPVASCGTFKIKSGTTSVRFSIPYPLKLYDGWVVTREVFRGHHPGPVVLSTFV